MSDKCQNLTFLFNQLQTEKPGFDGYFNSEDFNQLQTQKPEFDAAFDNGDFVKAKNLRKTIDKIIRDIWLEIKVRRREELTIGDITKDKLLEEMQARRIEFTQGAFGIMDSEQFRASDQREKVTLVWLKVSDLGFTEPVTLKEVYRAAIKRGLELCPARVGPVLRLRDTQQPENDYYMIAMMPISNSFNGPRIFNITRSSSGTVRLQSFSADLGAVHQPDQVFVYCLDQEEK